MLPDCSDEQEQTIAVLQARGCATVARINYRASSLHPYPTPCHDVLAGWDWVRENLLRHDSGHPHLAKVGVCGELVGGSLATMLALTECRLGESRIAAAAMNNPVVDWVFPDHLPPVNPAELPEPIAPDETSLPADEDLAQSQVTLEAEEERPTRMRKQRKRTPKTPPPNAWQSHADNEVLPTVTLCGERDMLFRRPDDYFDRFASPIHFFRSPYAQLILPQSDDVSASLQPDLELDMESQMHLNHFSSLDSNSLVAPIVPALARCRSYARHYPPAGTNLSLPSWNVTTGLHSPLFDQANDLAKMIKRSVARHMLKSQSGRTKWFDATEKQRYEELAQQRIDFHVGQGLGLWTQQHDNPGWKADVENVASWMKAHLSS